MLDDVAAYLLLAPIATVIVACAGIIALRRTPRQPPARVGERSPARPRISSDS